MTRNSSNNSQIAITPIQLQKMATVIDQTWMAATLRFNQYDKIPDASMGMRCASTEKPAKMGFTMELTQEILALATAQRELGFRITLLKVLENWLTTLKVCRCERQVTLCSHIEPNEVCQVPCIKPCHVSPDMCEKTQRYIMYVELKCAWHKTMVRRCQFVSMATFRD